MKLRKIMYRLYPTRAQEERLAEALRHHQQLYNAALQERIDCYRKTGRGLSYNDQQASLTQIRAEHDEYRAIPVYSTRMTLRRLDKAFKSFFRRVAQGEAPGFPRFKSINRFSSFEMCAGAGCGWSFTFGEQGQHGKLNIRNIGSIRARGRARTDGKAKTSQVMHRHGRWWLSLTAECEPVRVCEGLKAAGLDWGVESLGTLTHECGASRTLVNPRYWQTEQERIVGLQQEVCRKKRGSSRWRRACRRLAAVRRTQAARRHHEHHVKSAEIAKTYTLLVTEKLTIRNLTRNSKGTLDAPGKNVRQKAGLNREILDTAPAKWLAMIRYKVEETGGEFVEAPTRNLKPSQRCPDCWAVRKKTLSERQHRCECGSSMTRDAASALVVLRWALGVRSETDLAGHSA